VERLQRFLAHAGVASRRAAEALIRDGRVAVNGAIVSQMGVQIDPERDQVTLDGRPVRGVEAPFYAALHKPRGYVSSARDERGRPTVLALLPSAGRLYPVGRLDLDSEGLLLITNDGDLTHRLLHPSHLVEKEYHVRIARPLSDAALDRLRHGILLDEGMTAPAVVERLDGQTMRGSHEDDGGSWLRVTLREGRKRQVRRMVAAVGGRVVRLIRVRVDGVHLGRLGPGQWRRLTQREIAHLRGDRD
jgi:pseudouridine synthase